MPQKKKKFYVKHNLYNKVNLRDISIVWSPAETKILLSVSSDIVSYNLLTYSFQ